MVWVVKLCLPVSHLEIFESRLLSNRAKSFWVSPLAFRISLMRSVIPKDKSNSAFCSAGINALLNLAKIIFLLITYSLISEQLRIIVIRIHYGAKQYTTTQILPLASRLWAIHMAHFLWWAMSAIRYRREQGGMATVSDKSYQETSEGRVMNTTEFREIELQIREEKLCA